MDIIRLQKKNWSSLRRFLIETGMKIKKKNYTG